ncbi:MAG: hypothetical protein GF364_03050, partial [Candidatus Lokiarchaeota archaeon]|nr:hypothetical protein [Candidatus Lokiarchaeota archaeon]
MSKTKLKTTTILTVLMISAFIIPTVPLVNAQTTMAEGMSWNVGLEDFDNASAVADMPAGMASTLADIFGMMSFLGPSGAALGHVFEILFENIMNMERMDDKVLDGVYMLNASYTDKFNTWTDSYTGRTERYWLYRNDYASLGFTGAPVIETSKSGTVTVEYTAGAHVIFLLWDNDGSLIAAINKIYQAYWDVRDALESLDENPEQWTEAEIADLVSIVIGSVLEAVTYLLFHINDIITGDELIITNIITWETWNYTTSSDYTQTVEIKDYYNGQYNPSTVSIGELETQALAVDDDYAVQLLEDVQTSGVQEKTWSTFSFNLVELWLKNFEIHINASVIADHIAYTMTEGQAEVIGEPLDPETGLAKIFQGLDIELYLLTHSLFGFVAFDDTMIEANNVPDVLWQEATEDGIDYEYIEDSEVKYWFALKSFDATPVFEIDIGDGNGVDVYDKNGAYLGKGISWSFRMENVDVIPVPVGLTPGDLDSLPPAENLEFIEMGFTFLPKQKGTYSVETGKYQLATEQQEVNMGAGIIKLDQSFGEWNSGGVVNAELAGLDFAVLFISTMLYFHVNVEVETVDPVDYETLGTENTTGLVEKDAYSNGEISVGNYENDLPLASVDIAGPQYEQYEDGPTNPPQTYDADTTNITLAYLNFNLGGSCVYIDDQNPDASFRAEGFLEIGTSIMIYAVAYGHWDGSGDQLIHDPTFSVFM